MSPSEIVTLNFFSLNCMEFLTFNQIFNIIFGFLQALPQNPPGALYLTGDVVSGNGTHSFVPLRNKQIPGYAPAVNVECTVLFQVNS